MTPTPDERAALKLFVRESNWIEGIKRAPTAAEIEAHQTFLALESVGVADVEALVAVVAPGKPLRELPTMNVRVGNHVAPQGGPLIRHDLHCLLEANSMTPYERHTAYETLHPFMDGNGRSGRAIWLRDMGGLAGAPLGFLHHWYYQSLDALRSRARTGSPT